MKDVYIKYVLKNNKFIFNFFIIFLFGNFFINYIETISIDKVYKIFAQLSLLANKNFYIRSLVFLPAIIKMLSITYMFFSFFVLFKTAHITVFQKNFLTKIFIKHPQYWFRFLFIFLLPQVIIGLSFAANVIIFSSYNNEKICLFFRNLICIITYTLGIISLFNFKNFTHTVSIKVNYLFLIFYVIISLFISCFYNGYPYSLISYLTEQFIYMANNPFNDFNCDSLCRSFKFLFTGNYFDN